MSKHLLKWLRCHDETVYHFWVNYDNNSLFLYTLQACIIRCDRTIIIVMLPILDIYLGFSGEMMSLITALYILFDPVITSANIFGNGAFAKIMDMGLSNILNKKSG